MRARTSAPASPIARSPVLPGMPVSPHRSTRGTYPCSRPGWRAASRRGARRGNLLPDSPLKRVSANGHRGGGGKGRASAMGARGGYQRRVREWGQFAERGGGGEGGGTG